MCVGGRHGYDDAEYRVEQTTAYSGGYTWSINGPFREYQGVRVEVFEVFGKWLIRGGGLSCIERVG